MTDHTTSEHTIFPDCATSHKHETWITWDEGSQWDQRKRNYGQSGEDRGAKPGLNLQ